MFAYRRGLEECERASTNCDELTSFHYSMRILKPSTFIRSKANRLFSLMPLLIVIAFIFYILAAALPEVNQAKCAANEMRIVKEIRAIHTGQEKYNSQFGKFAVALSELGPPPSGTDSATAADLIPLDLASGKKNGFTIQLQGTPSGYTITANPDFYKGSGRRSFYSDQTLVIHENWGPEPATASSPAIK